MTLLQSPVTCIIYEMSGQLAKLLAGWRNIFETTLDRCYADPAVSKKRTLPLDSSQVVVSSPRLQAFFTDSGSWMAKSSSQGLAGI